MDIVVVAAVAIGIILLVSLVIFLVKLFKHEGMADTGSGAYADPKRVSRSGETVTVYVPAAKGSNVQKVTLVGKELARYDVDHQGLSFKIVAPAYSERDSHVAIKTVTGKGTWDAYVDYVPSIYSTSYPAGSPVTIKGIGFTNVKSVKYDGVNASFNVVDDGTITTPRPTQTGQQNPIRVTVETSDGVSNYGYIDYGAV